MEASFLPSGGTPDLGNCCTSNVIYMTSESTRPRWGRPRYRDNAPIPRGIHDFYNMMWDPRIRRGLTNVKTPPPPPCKPVSKVRPKLKPEMTQKTPRFGPKGMPNYEKKFFKRILVPLTSEEQPCPPQSGGPTRTSKGFKRKIPQNPMKFSKNQGNTTSVAAEVNFCPDREPLLKSIAHQLVDQAIHEAIVELAEEEEERRCAQERSNFTRKLKDEQNKLEKLKNDPEIN